MSTNIILGLVDTTFTYYVLVLEGLGDDDIAVGPHFEVKTCHRIFKVPQQELCLKNTYYVHI